MAYIYDLSDTWNAAGTTFFGIKMNVTNSASASGSKLLSLQVASTEYFGVDKNGNVTIGNGGDLRISSATGGDDSIIYNDAEDLYFNTNGAVRAVINSSGNVGIGTASPLSKATVSQSGTVKLSLESQGSWNAGVGADASGNLLFYNPLATERMRIDSSGNIGVGTSSPQSRFHVDVPAGGGSFFTGTGNYNGGYPTAVFGLNIGYNFQAGAADVDFFNSWTGATGSQGGFSFRRQTGASSQTSLMRIDGSGNVGIGTSSPSDKLSVSDGTATFQFKPLGGSSIGYMGMRTNHALGFTTNDTERVRIDSSGNLLVGTSSAFDNVSYLKGQFAGGVATKIGGTSAASQVSFFNDNGRVGFIYTDGTSTGYSTSSDSRLKHDIIDAPEASDLIDRIKVRSFKWNSDNSEQRYGFVAQELIEVASEAVFGDPEGEDMMAVDYSKLVPMLVKELQSLRARVAQLEGN